MLTFYGRIAVLIWLSSGLVKANTEGFVFGGRDWKPSTASTGSQSVLILSLRLKGSDPDLCFPLTAASGSDMSTRSAWISHEARPAHFNSTWQKRIT